MTLGLTEDLFHDEASPQVQPSPQFKAETVRMVIWSRKPIVVVARDLGTNTVALWN